MHNTPAPRGDYQAGAEQGGIAPQTIQQAQQANHDAAIGDDGFAPRSLTELHQVATLAIRGGYAPRGTTPEGAMLAIAKGREAGLPALYSLQNIAVINGKPSIYGDAAVALVHRSGKLEHFHEYIDGDGDAAVGVCEVQREGLQKHVAKFSAQDARRAGLWGKQGPWKSYPHRMLQMRARGFALRDQFADILAGMITQEEARDYPAKEKPRQAEVVKDEPDPFTEQLVNVQNALIDTAPAIVGEKEPEHPRVAESKKAVEAAVVETDKYGNLFE